AVNGEMLRSGNHMFGLNRAHLMPSKLCSKVRIFTVGFNRPSPTGIARQIQYRRIDIRISEDARFFSSDVADLVHKRAIPRARDAQLRWKTRRTRMGETPNAFIRKIHRDAEPGLFDEESLNGIDGFGVLGMRQRELGLRNASIDDAIQMFVDVSNAILP